MQVDLNFLLEKKTDFYNLTQSEQIKYLAFVFTKNNKVSSFNINDVKQVFDNFNLVIPTNFGREFKKLLNGRIPILVRKSNGYVFHPSTEEDLTLEIFSNKEEHKQTKIDNLSSNTELFSKYDFHPIIKQVAFEQFQKGFYKEAILNAFIEVINQVKQRSGNPIRTVNGRNEELDGDYLMNRVFGCDGDQVPIIKFNNLRTSLDKAEQRGLMNLYKGIVGIRDKKAHLNFIQNDPIKTIEYLSLASLLTRLLDEYEQYS